MERDALMGLILDVVRESGGEGSEIEITSYDERSAEITLIYGGLQADLHLHHDEETSSLPIREKLMNGLGSLIKGRKQFLQENES